MIFVSVGTQDVNFDRLINGVINEVDKGNIKEEVIVQCGVTNIKTNKVNNKSNQKDKIDQKGKIIFEELKKINN